MSARLMPQLPKGDQDGLTAMGHRVPLGDTVPAVIALQHVASEERTDDKEPRIEKYRIVAIEPMDADGTANTIEEMLARRYEDRTGKQPLPFDELGVEGDDGDESLEADG